MPVHYPEAAGEPYRPSNGTEGEMFQEHFCYQCGKSRHCTIIGQSMCFGLEDPEYPSQLKFDADGRPTCTEFEPQGESMFIAKKRSSTVFERDETLKLGDKARDQISGFTGTIVAITEWLNGCRRITIQPSMLHEGKPVDNSTFDAEQVEKVEESPPLSPSRTGGPAIAPARSSDPV